MISVTSHRLGAGRDCILPVTSFIVTDTSAENFPAARTQCLFSFREGLICPCQDLLGCTEACSTNMVLITLTEDKGWGSLRAFFFLRILILSLLIF